MEDEMPEICEMKIFVTGGAGFIGSHLVDRLISLGNQVAVYDNLSSGNESHIKQYIENPSFSFIKADLLNLDLLAESMRGYDVVFHLAANPDARQGITNTRLDLEQNTIATYNVLESMRRNGIERIVFTSSGTVYGETPNIPIEEEYGPLLPISLYGASKLACESMTSAFCTLFGMQAWIFRLGNIVGPRATHGVIFDLISKLRKDRATLEVLGDGYQRKPYVYIDDCLEGIFIGVEKAEGKVNVFNLAVSSVTSVRGIVRIIFEKAGLEDTVVNYTGGRGGWPGDVPRIKMSSRKLERLGWKPKYTSDEAVAKSVEFFLDRFPL